MNLNKYIETSGQSKPVVKGTKIKVEEIVHYHEDMGWSIEKIARKFEIEEKLVNSALAFYFENVDLIRSSMENKK